jgi:hypothetical protein
MFFNANSLPQSGHTLGPCTSSKCSVRNMLFRKILLHCGHLKLFDVLVDDCWFPSRWNFSQCNLFFYADQQAGMLSINTEEVSCTSTSSETEKDGMSTSSSSTSCQTDKDSQMFIAASSSNMYRCTHCVESFESTKELVEHCEKFHLIV